MRCGAGQGCFVDRQVGVLSGTSGSSGSGVSEPLHHRHSAVSRGVGRYRTALPVGSRCSLARTGKVVRGRAISASCSALRYALDVRCELSWDDEDAVRIRDRSVRYPGATDVEPAWTLAAAADEHRVVRDPDPKSTAAYVRIIGYSSSANFVLTVRGDGMEDAWS